MKAALDIEQTIKLGWATFIKYPMEAILGMVIVWVISGLTFGLLAGPMFVGYNRMILSAIRGDEIGLGDVFGGFDAFIPSLLVFLVVAILASIGFVFLVLPGLAVIIFSFWALFIVSDQDVNAFAALQRSFEYTKDNLGPALVFVLVVLLLGGVGSLVAFGSLITAPLAHIMAVHGYVRAFGSEPSPATSSSAPIAA